MAAASREEYISSHSDRTGRRVHRRPQSVVELVAAVARWERVQTRYFQSSLTVSPLTACGKLAAKVTKGDNLTAEDCNHYKCNWLPNTQITNHMTAGETAGTSVTSCKYHSFHAFVTLVAERVVTLIAE